MKFTLKIAAAFFLILTSSSLFSQALPEWKYKRTIAITNTDSIPYANQHFLLPINKTTLGIQNKLNDSASDLRFTIDSQTTNLPYWIEGDAASTILSVWIQIPLLQPNAQTLLSMYYGNDSASSMSSGDSTFDFFDDFSGSAIDTNKWIFTKDNSVDYTLSNSQLQFTQAGAAYMVSKPSKISAPFTMHTKVNGFSAYSWDLTPLGYGNENETFRRVAFFSGLAFRHGTGFRTLGLPASFVPTTPITNTLCDSFYTFSGDVKSNGSILIRTPLDTTFVSTSWVVSNPTRVSIGYFYNPGNATGTCASGRKFDNVFVTKTTLNPLVLDSIGEEQNNGPQVSLKELSKLDIQTWPNPVTNELNILVTEPSTNMVITDILGKVQITMPLTSHNNIVNTSSLLPGVYVALISNSTNQKNAQIKFVKQ